MPRRIVLTLFLLVASLFCQRTHPCAYDAYRDRLLAQTPGFAAQAAAIEAHTRLFVRAGSRALGPTIYRIPIVVHIVWNTPMQNLSDAQVQTQIDVLNEDFRRMNADAAQTAPQFVSVAADCGIEFCLAAVDPQGNPTTGITRRQTNVQAFDPFTDNVKSTAMGGTDPWPEADYLNIWVCPLFFGLLGYASPPGSPPGLDGVVIAWGHFGRPGPSPVAPGLDQGRTCTHEVGHYLNLQHVWGTIGGCSDDDQVADTPNCTGPNMGCNLAASSCGSTDMIQNFLDYTPDNCMNLFTQGQRMRMRALFTPGGARESLLTSPAACSAPQVDYQVNSAAASLDADGVLATTTTPALVTVSNGSTVTLTAASTNNAGMSWDMGFGSAPLIAASGGALTSGTQILNLDVADPAFGTWFNGFSGSPAFSGFSAPVMATGPQTVSLQMGIVDPGQATGLSLSQATRVTVP